AFFTECGHDLSACNMIAFRFFARERAGASSPSQRAHMVKVNRFQPEARETNLQLNVSSQHYDVPLADRRNRSIRQPQPLKQRVPYQLPGGVTALFDYFNGGSE